MMDNHPAGPAVGHGRGGTPPQDAAAPPRLSVPHPLVALPSAAGCARRYARAQARAWGLPGLADAAGLLASALVARAVATTGAAAPTRYADLYDRPLNFVVLRLRAHGPGLVIEVWDRDPAPPIPRTEPAAAKTGRRLSVLASLASRWGCYPSGGGKVVWCECRPRTPAAEPGPAPARTPWAGPAATAAR